MTSLGLGEEAKGHIAMAKAEVDQREIGQDEEVGPDRTCALELHARLLQSSLSAQDLREEAVTLVAAPAGLNIPERTLPRLVEAEEMDQDMAADLRDRLRARARPAVRIECLGPIKIGKSGLAAAEVVLKLGSIYIEVGDGFGIRLNHEGEKGERLLDAIVQPGLVMPDHESPSLLRA
ncbi:MAG: hypothetical protein HY720_07785 [Planctomycetes bacterium]|nr:hypothetical protein [Planctomycetota bacterium]